jgi:hypothetical protein
MGHNCVDEALGGLGDQSLIAEVNRYRRCYGWSAVVFDMNSGGVILNVNNEYQRSAHILEGIQWSKGNITITRE